MSYDEPAEKAYALGRTQFQPAWRRWLLALLWLLLGQAALAQLPLPLANPNLGDLREIRVVRQVASTPDGGFIVLGDFGLFADQNRQGIARLSNNGTLLDWPVVAAGGPVEDVFVAAPYVYFSGGFGSINGQPRRGLARVLLDSGELDPWNPNTGTAGYRFRAIVANATHAWVGGEFNSVGGQPRDNLVKLSVDGVGAVDPDWVANTNAFVTRLLLAEGALFAVGNFTSVNGAPRERAVKLPLAGGGAPDPTWTPQFNGEISTAVIDGGQLYAVGCFGQVNGVGRSFLARVSTGGSGTLDAAWNPAPNGGCTYALGVTATSVYVGGFFSAVNGVARSRLARVSKTAPGNVDPLFAPQADNATFLAREFPDGNVLVGGQFVQWGAAYHPGLVRVSGSSAQPIGPVLWSEGIATIAAMVRQPDGKIVVGGTIARAGNEIRRHLLRLNTDGSLDASFTTGTVGNVSALAVSGEHIYVGGAFGLLGGQPATNLGRISLATGAPDTTWAPAPFGEVLSIALDEAAGQVYFGGTFTQVGGVGPRGRVARASMANGAVDAWNPDAGGVVLSLAVDTDAVYVGGDFATVAGQPRQRLAKLGKSVPAVLDPAFSADANQAVRALALGPASTLYVGGNFNNIAGLGRPGFARLSRTTGLPDPSWSTFLSSGSVDALISTPDAIWLSGFFFAVGDQTRNWIARVSHSGEVAPLFAPTPNSAVTRMALDGSRIYMSGFFSDVGGVPRTRLAALPVDATPVATVTTITSDEPENSQPHQVYRVSVNVSGSGNLPVANQPVTIEDDLGALCNAFLDAAGNGACELASREAGVRTLTARFAGSALLLPSMTTEAHTVAATSPTPPINPAITLQSNGQVRAAVRLSDGSLVIGGTFTRVGELPRRGLARLLPDGTVDASFHADVTGSVTGLARDGNDNLYVVGSFGYIDGVLRRNVAKLDAAGNVFAGWSAGETCVSTILPDLVVDPAGDLILPGCAQFISGPPSSWRLELIKLAGSNGARMGDLSAEVTTNDFPIVGVRLLDGQLYLHGSFQAVNGIARQNLARLSTDGAVDNTWDPAPDGLVRAVVGDGSGGHYVAGAYNVIAGQNRPFLARLDASGALDAGFSAAPNAEVRGILRINGALQVVGFFFEVGGAARRHLARLDPATGAALGAFMTPAGFQPATLIAHLGDSLLVEQSTHIYGPEIVDFMGAVRFDLASGSTLPTSVVTTPAFVRALARQADGSTLVGGFFAVPGSGYRNLVRITPAGVLDSSFQPQIPNSVNAIKVDSVGMIYLGADGVRKLLPDGSFAPGFVSGIENSLVLSLLVAPDGIVAGGSFSSASGLTRRGIAKLDSQTGAALPGWDAGLSSPATVRAIQSDTGGALYIGGAFSQVAGVGRSNLAKLDASGALASGWSANANATVRSLLVHDTDVYVGGDFNNIAGVTRRGIARLSTVDGAVDASWDPAGSRSANVQAMARAADGGIFVGGSFLRIGNAYRSRAAKLDPVTGLADPSWNPSFDATVWAILAGYGDTPTRSVDAGVLNDVSIGGSFEFAGSVTMPGYVVLPPQGTPLTDAIFCSGFETAACVGSP